MKGNGLQVVEGAHSDRELGGAPANRAIRILIYLAVFLLALATVACDDDFPGLTSEEMQSDPMPDFDDAAFAGLWLSDGEYISFERAEHGLYLLHPPAKKDGSEPEKAIPFRLKRAGNLLMMEYWEETENGKVYRPCWVGVEENALELHCLIGSKLPELGIEFETRKSGDSEVKLIRASQERLKQLYQEQMRNEKVFENTLHMTRPQPARVSRLKQRAMKGSAEAQEQLAEIYDSGEITARDEAEALKWAQRAAESGRASGEVLYGDLLLVKARKGGNDLETGNLNHEARGWYERAAEKKYRLAYSRLGHLYENSFFEDDSSAVDSYRRGAELGDAESYAQLGIRYHSGKGVPQDNRLALKYLEAVPEGSRETATWKTLAEIYLSAVEPELRDPKRALSAAEAASRGCQYCDSHALLARACFENGLYERAVAEQQEVVGNVTDETNEQVMKLAYYRSFVPGAVEMGMNKGEIQ